MDGISHLFYKDEAIKFGLKEAIILEFIRESHVHRTIMMANGKVWVDIPRKVFYEKIPYLTKYSIDTAIKNLTKNKIIKTSGEPYYHIRKE